MAVIRPFRGLRFDPARAGKLENVVCPPYDVVDEAERKRLTALSPYNLIRVELPQEKPSQPATDADYQRAAKTLETWEKEAVLLREAKPCLYPYVQGYVGPDGKRRERRGFLTALRVEDYDGGAVRPHEKTLASPKEDRFKLLSATQTNVSPVFGLYDDANGKVSEVLAKTIVEEPISEFTDSKGVEHRVWRMDKAESQGAVRSALSQSRIYIADGHHRYETAIRYRNFRRDGERRSAAAHPSGSPSAPGAALGGGPALGTAPFDFALAYLADVRDPGLAVFPIHRLAKLPPGMDAASLREGLGRFFEIEELAGVDPNVDPASLAGRLESAIQTPTRREKLFAFYSPRLAVAWILRSKDALQTFLVQAGLPRPVAGLDVTALHRAILEETLHASYAEGTVHFAHSATDAVKIARGEGSGHGDKAGFDAAILTNATKVTELLQVVDAGETMPQKSTFFFPKPASGIVMNRLDE
jgi:uncharacterized protein (DUF1015 family)